MILLIKNIKYNCKQIQLQVAILTEWKSTGPSILAEKFWEKKKAIEFDKLPHISSIRSSYLYKERRLKRTQDLQATMAEQETMAMHMKDWRGSDGKT